MILLQTFHFSQKPLIRIGTRRGTSCGCPRCATSAPVHPCPDEFAPIIPKKEPLLRWRVVVLAVLLLLSLALYILLNRLTIPRDEYIPSYLVVWLLCFIPYLIACVFVLNTQPLSRRQQAVELGVIFLAALAFRILLLPLSPLLSHDSWRYLWDARIILHGYSPYVYVPDSSALVPLRDTLIYGNSGYRDVPTIYPPGAQAIYVISYLLAPSNLFFLKGIFIGFEMVTCVALVFLLKGKGLDPRRAIIYAWCPLPIVEFAAEGHVDVTTITFMVLALLFATSSRPRDRVFTGLFIALAALTKIYPIVLLVVVMRRRDWGVVLTCFITILIGYIPFIILGHGQVLGFFLTYASEQRQNAGPVPLLIHSITSGWLHQTDQVTAISEFGIDIVLMGMAIAGIARLRLHKRIDMESATLLLISSVYLLSSHIFPWYNAALLPWLAFLVGPLWTREGMSSKGIAAISVWYFICVSIINFFFRNSPPNGWELYYMLAYIVPLAGVGIAVSLTRLRKTKLKLVTH